MGYKECINQRTMTHKFDTAALLTKLNESLQSGLQDLLHDFVANYELYEQTHFHLLQTPALRGLAQGDNGNIISTQMQKIFELKAEVAALKAELNELKGSKKTQTENIQIKIEDPEVVVVEPGPVKRVYVNLLDEQPVVKKEPATLKEVISEEEEASEQEEEEEDEEEEDEEASEQEDEQEEQEQDKSEAEQEPVTEAVTIKEVAQEESETEVDEEDVSEAGEADEEDVSEAEESEAEESEAEEEEEAEELEEAVEEVVIKGTRYYADNTTDGRIYAITADEEVGEEVGIYVNGKPKMYKK
jgi:hypothetical protein